MPPKRATKAASAPAPREPVATRSTRSRPQQSEPATVPGGSDRGMATRTRAAALNSSTPSTPSKIRFSLTQDPVPRRGPPPVAAHSEVDIPSSRPRNEDDSDDGNETLRIEEVTEVGFNDNDSDNEAHSNDDEEEDDNEVVEEAAEDEDKEEDDNEVVEEAAEDEDKEEDFEPDQAAQEAAIIEVEDDEFQFMRHNLAKLSSTAEGLLAQYRDFDDKDGIARRSFELDLDTLGAVRKHFVVHKPYGPFLQWKWLQSRANMSEEEVAKFKTVLILANLATLLEVIYNGAKDNSKASREAEAKTLAIIDKGFQDLVLGGDRVPVTQPIVSFALEIRAARLLAALASAKKNGDARKLVFNIFCSGREDATPEEVDQALRNGPYLPVAGHEGEDVNNLCYAQVAKFVKRIGQEHADFSNLAKLRQSYFRVQDLLAAITTMKSALLVRPSRETQASMVEGVDEFHDAASEFHDGDDDDDDESEAGASQPIVRMSNTQAGPSLFKDATDIQALEGYLPGPPAASPSSGQRINHLVNPKASLLSSHPSRYLSRGDRDPSPPRQQGKKRAYDQVDLTGNGDDDEDDDEHFETDRRRISPGYVLKKRSRMDEVAHAARVEESLRQQQRARMPFANTDAQPSSSTTAVGGLTQRTTAAPPNGTATTLVAGLASSPSPPPPQRGPFLVVGRQRHPWSDRDSQVLLAKIQQHYGQWGKIEEDDKQNHIFDHPRNQQAYRDRARNMKVHFLLNDMRLPRGFDGVALSGKEVQRVIKADKNSMRREEDYDMATGRPTNTAYVPGQAVQIHERRSRKE